MADLPDMPAGGNPAADVGLASVLLPPVVHEASAAILVVDLARRTVLFANDLARQLVPDRELPVAVDEWSELAGLEDVGGSDLPPGPDAPPSSGKPAESLLRIAQGEPVTGEAVTARRATSVTSEREVLWVLGLPLSGAPEPMASLALVVILPARNARLISGVQESAVTLRDRAVLATRMSFAITDPNQPDDPLVWVNPAFTETTGYSFDEAVGRNCRFLQGPDTDPHVVAELRESLAAQRPMTATLLNYRKDGTAFWNELSISPVRDHRGELTHFVGVQADVTARVEAQRSRDDALSQVALAADRLALLADFTARMAMAQQPQGIVEMLARALTPRLGTWTAIYTFDESGRVTRPYILHERQSSDPDVHARIERLRDVGPQQLTADGPIWSVLRGDARQVHVRDYDAEQPQISGSADDERTALMHQLGTHSLVVVPLVARGGILGCVAVIADANRRALGEEELALVRDLAVRAGLMLENSQLYARERATAATLQRNLLPRLPQLPGIEIAASYVPAADEAAVGGDWYDVFALRGDGRQAAVVVGDVMGHNYHSAARMGKLSTILRSYAWRGGEPSDVLSGVDELLEGTGTSLLATCLYVRLTLTDTGASLHYSSAGHPPAMVRHPDGHTEILEDGRGPMIGVSRLVAASRRRPDGVLELARGATLICFTDGLTDAVAREPDLDLGLAELCRIVRELPIDASPQRIVDELTGRAQRHSDDVAVVALCIE